MPQLDSGSTPDDAVRTSRPARRAQLIEAALESFVAQGYHVAAMDDIAERVGISKPVLYRHFPGKLDLYRAALDQAVEKIIAGTREALVSTAGNKQRVTAAMHAFYKYVASEHGEFRLVFESDLTNEASVRELIDRATRECSNLIARLIHADTGLPDAACQLLAAGLVGMAQVSARFWLQAGPGDNGGIDQADAAAIVAGLAWRGIAGYPGSLESV